MLPFLAFPRHFIDTPIVKDGLRFLRQEMPSRTRWWRLIEALLVVCCLIAAILPAFMPIFTINRMLAIYLPTVLLSWSVISRTMLCGAALGSREGSLGMLDDLILTPLDAPQIIFGKWWATLRYCWRGHALMIVLRFMAAYHIAAFFMYAPASGGTGATLGNICPSGMNAFCYGMNGFMPPTDAINYWMYTQPLFLFGLVGIGILIIGAGLELGLATLLGICASIQSATRPSLSVMIWRGLLLAFSLAVMIVGNSYYATVLNERHNAYSPRIYEIAYDRRIDLLETLQVAASPLVDQGILLSTNFLRPSYSANSIMYQIRQVLAAMLSWLSYGATILLLLWAAIDTAVQRRALPGAIGTD